MNRDTYEKIVALRLPGMAKTYLVDFQIIY